MKNLTAGSMVENKLLLMAHFLDSLSDYSIFVLQLSKKKRKEKSWQLSKG